MKFITFIFLILGFQAYANSTPSYRHIPSPKGCEDIELDQSQSERLILSCDDRDDHSMQGGIYSFDLQTEQMTQFQIKGIKIDSFHPHGIYLKVEKSAKKLYVISHASKDHTDVFIFEVNGNELVFLENIGGINQPLYSQPNDLFVYPDGTVFMSNPTSVMHGVLKYDLNQKKWVSFFGGRVSYMNGVHGVGRKLYVNDSTGVQHMFELDSSFKKNKHRVNLSRVKLADNLSEDSEGYLYFCGVNSTFQFMRHFFNHNYFPESTFFRYDPVNDILETLDRPEKVWQQIAAPSVVVRFKDRLFVGQVFNSGLLEVTNPKWTE